ncbi:MAG: FHA domain-containing protein [Anaerolineae bacterium]|nr:FHA domain-containing protein [Anaerolineae bacterium]
MTYPAANNPNSSQLQLVVHAGPLAGKGYPITGNTLTFGRGSDNDIVLDDTQVSRNHARLIRQGDEVIIEDLGSTNGTLVNGKPVVGQHILQPADIISIGSSVFGVKGFAAPSTIGVTQISMEKRTYPPPIPSAPPSPPRIPSPPPRRPAPAAQKAEPARLNMLVMGGLIALILVVVIIAAVTAYFLTQDRGSGVAGIPTVVITAPTANSQVQINVPVTVQATASDPSGVKRMELWVSNIKTADAVSPVDQGQATLTASFQWTPPAPGTYTLEVKAFNSQGQVSAPTTVTVNAVGESAAETPTPPPTPDTPTPTVPTNPSLTTKTDLNVRSGPGTQYDLLGLLPAGVTVEIVGRDEARQWWQVRFSPAADGIGWVAADPAFSTTANVDNVAVAQAPPTPTGTPTPTDTPVPPTSTPTVTNIPAPPTPTDTPTLTPTATGQPTLIEFNVSPTNIQGGECVNITWSVSGVREVYFEDQGVGGQANFTDCPEESKTYDFRVIRQDGSEYREEIRVEVNNPVVSAGSTEIPADETIDLDDGDIPGNDFRWEVDGDTRLFRARDGVQLAPMRDLSDLRNLSKGDCESAAFGVYDVIDGSDDASDPTNTLIEGRSACYRTSEGRLGKLWFPNGVSRDLDIEWVTWQ